MLLNPPMVAEERSIRTVNRNVRRFPIIPPREPELFKAGWTIEWIGEQQEDKLLKIIDEKKITTLHFHLNHLSGGWGLLEIGLPSQKHVLLIDGTVSDSYETLKEVISKTTNTIVVFDVIKLCASLLKLEISADRIFDIQMRATHHFPWLRYCGIFNLAEQLLGVGLPNQLERYDWNSRPLSFEQVQFTGVGAELCYHLYKHLKDPSHSTDKEQKLELSLVK